MFCALVGSSILKGRIINPFIRCCRLGLAEGEMGVVKGVLCLTNASPVFPLSYTYEAGLEVASDLDAVHRCNNDKREFKDSTNGNTGQLR